MSIDLEKTIEILSNKLGLDREDLIKDVAVFYVADDFGSEGNGSRISIGDDYIVTNAGKVWKLL